MSNQIIIAMDMEIPEGIRLISELRTSTKVYGYKIGSLWILDRGLNILKTVRDMLKEVDSPQKIILDMQKWGTDTPDIITKQVNKAAPYVDELIVCPMGSGSNSLKAFTLACHNDNIKPLCVLEMTHPNADSYLARYAKIMIVEDCLDSGLRSFIIPSTKEPNNNLKSQIESYSGKNNTEYYTTGLKTQGGQIKPMIDFGVSKFIVGRAIYESEDPLCVIDNFYKEINEVL